MTGPHTQGAIDGKPSLDVANFYRPMMLDENSIGWPCKVAPVERNVSGLSSDFTRTFAPRSLTILRLKTLKTCS